MIDHTPAAPNMVGYYARGALSVVLVDAALGNLF
jgi:hypothetical protein